MWAEINFEIVKLPKRLQISQLIRFDNSLIGSTFIGPHKESKCFIKINFHEILLQTHFLVKF